MVVSLVSVKLSPFFNEAWNTSQRYSISLIGKFLWNSDWCSSLAYLLKEKFTNSRFLFIHLHARFSSAEGRGDIIPRRTWNISQSTAMSNSSSESTSERDQARSDMYSLRLVLGRPLVRFPVGVAPSPIFPWTFWKMKWLDIHSITPFTPGHFVAKYHTVNSLQKSHLCPGLSLGGRRGLPHYKMCWT